MSLSTKGPNETVPRSFKNYQRMAQAAAARLQAQKAAQAERDSAREEAAVELEQTGQGNNSEKNGPNQTADPPIGK